MRILVTADLHYDIPRSREPTEALARRAVRAGGDAIVLVGDTCGRDIGPLRQCLRLFAGFPGRKLLVPGNHCLWCDHGQGSLDRYERLLPAAAEDEGFTVLDHQPVTIATTGLAGSIGWYDYSFRDESLGIPEAFYEAKLSPGAAVHYGGHDELLAVHEHVLTARQMDLGVAWMDGQHVRLPMSDAQFVDVLADKLARQLAAMSADCERIVAFLHHLPFELMVPPGRPDRFAFVAAYMGAERLGEVLLNCRKLTHVYCGHSHWRDKRRVGHLQVVNIGSTYTDKHLEVLDLPE